MILGNAKDLILARIERLECPICGDTVTNADDFKCVEDKNITKLMLWVCKKHKTDENNGSALIAFLLAG